MTDKQKDLIISVFRMGIACGMNTFWEAYLNYKYFMPHLMPYTEIPSAQQDLDEAFAAFLQGASSGPNDPIEQIKPKEVEEYISQMSNNYRRLLEQWKQKK